MNFLVSALLLISCSSSLAASMASATGGTGFHHKGGTVRATKRRLDRNLERTGKSKGKGGKTNKGTKMPSSMPSANPTMRPTILASLVPSTSQQPSISSAPSAVPSLSGAPSEAPSTVPSVEPSVSNRPSTSQVPSLVPSESMVLTCIDNFRQRNGKAGKGGNKGVGKGKHTCDSASPSQTPSISNAPSTSTRPSTSPSISNAPSTSSEPSYLPSSSSSPSRTPTCKGKGCLKAPKKSRNNSDGSNGSPTREPPLISDTRSAEMSSASKEYPNALWLGNSIATFMILLALFVMALWD